MTFTRNENIRIEFLTIVHYVHYLVSLYLLHLLSDDDNSWNRSSSDEDDEDEEVTEEQQDNQLQRVSFYCFLSCDLLIIRGRLNSFFFKFL